MGLQGLGFGGAGIRHQLAAGIRVGGVLKIVVVADDGIGLHLGGIGRPVIGVGEGGAGHLIDKGGPAEDLVLPHAGILMVDVAPGVQGRPLGLGGLVGHHQGHDRICRQVHPAHMLDLDRCRGLGDLSHLEAGVSDFKIALGGHIALVVGLGFGVDPNQPDIMLPLRDLLQCDGAALLQVAARRNEERTLRLAVHKDLNHKVLVAVRQRQVLRVGAGIDVVRGHQLGVVDGGNLQGVIPGLRCDQPIGEGPLAAFLIL